MLKLTRKTEYALLALGHLCKDKPAGTTNVREIADTYQIPFPVLAKVMQQLARYGFVEPVKGAQGGYRMKVDPEEVDLWHFLEQMEGPLGLVNCMTEGDCNRISSCLIKNPLHIIDETIKDVFHRMTLQDVIQPVLPKPPEYVWETAP